MSERSALRYRTRGNASPQGRPRVYLCCHPNDLAELTDLTVDEDEAEVFETLGGTERDRLFVDIVARELRVWSGNAPEERSAMRTAIVFYSLEGNTHLAASGLAERLGADVFEIRAVKPYPTRGPLRILLGGKDATFNACPAIEPLDIDLSAYDQVVLGTPVWADKVAAPINTFLKGRDLDGKRLALLISSASGEAGKCAQDAASKLGRSVDELPLLSLRNPLKMDSADLASQLDAFATRISS